MAESRIFQVCQQRGTEGFTRIKEMLWPTMERIETLQRSGKSITGVPSGFADLDELTSGFQPSDLSIVAARPSMGKTAFCLNIAHARRGGRTRGGDLLAGNVEGIAGAAHAHRGSAGRQPGGAQRHARATSTSPRLARAAGMLQQLPRLDRRYAGADAARDALEGPPAQGRERRPADHRGLSAADAEPAEHSENREQEISDISRSLKALARELEVPVIALSQLSRASEQRGGERKRRSSPTSAIPGAIEQDADLVMFIYRPEMYDGPRQGRQQHEGVAEVIVAKHRNGPTGDATCTSTSSSPASTTCTERGDGD